MPPEPNSTSSSAASSSGKYSPREWEVVRKAFHASIMVDTPLASLAENLNVPPWPLKGKDETPSKYIDFTYDELITMPGLAGNPERVDLLVSILQETLAFDEPFGDMVTNDSLVDQRDNPILKNLGKLGIPEDFPVSLIALTPDTREFCTLENLTTIKSFAVFAQSISQNVVVGGDFRSLLNALSHVDEETLAQFLPFRPGEKGLHLIEGLALAIRAFPDEVLAALARRYGAKLGADDAAKAAKAPKQDVENAAEILTQHTASYIEYFAQDFAKLQDQVNGGVPVARLAIVLKDPLVETIATGLLRPYLVPTTEAQQPRTSTPPLVDEPVKKGFLSSLGRLFRKG